MTRFIRFDYALKALLRQKANFDILEGFLSELLKKDIKIKALLESESNQREKTDKQNRVDILAETHANEKILIEVQCSSEWDFLNRLLYGTSKLVTESLHKGDPYIKISKVISVSIVFFELGEGKDYIYKGNTTFKGIHRHDTLKLNSHEQRMYGGKEKPEDVMPEYYILRVKQFRQKIKDKFDEWMYFLQTEEIKPEFKARGIKEASKKLDRMKLSPKEKAAYERYMKELHYEASMVASHYSQGKEEGRQEGRQEGRGERDTEIVWRMHEQGLSVQDISKFTGLSEEKVKRISEKRGDDYASFN